MQLENYKYHVVKRSFEYIRHSLSILGNGRNPIYCEYAF